MTDAHRPRARGYFEEPDEAALPLIVALGRLVLSAAVLEKALQMELIRVHYERAHTSDDPEEYGLGKVLKETERLTSGQAQSQLDVLGIPEDLNARADRLSREPARAAPAEVALEDRVEQRLTERAATFEAGELRAVLLEQSVGELAPSQALARARTMVVERRILPLEGGLMTTLAVRAREQAIERRFGELSAASGRDVGEQAREFADDRIAERIGARMSDEQTHALEVITGPERGAILVGPAGTGKGVVIDAAARAEQLTGHRTYGIAVSGSTAQRLGRDSPALTGQTLTLDALVARVQRGRLAVDMGTTIYFDEAGMADTDRLDRLTELVAETGSKLVAIGDGAQLPSIGAGGMFDRLAQLAPSAQLSNVRRTLDPAEQRAWADLRAGRSDRAMAHYFAQGRLHLADTRDEAVEHAVRNWATLTETHPLEQVALISDASNKEIHRLNARAQHYRSERGELGEFELQVPGVHYGIREGDRVAMIHQHHEPGVERIENGARGEVLQISETGEVLIEFDVTGQQRTLAGDDLGRLRLGYAQHIHRAQGATVTRTIVVTGGWQTSKEPAYVEASRARQGTDWYVSREDLGVEGHDTDRIKRLAGAMSRSHAQTPSLAYPELAESDYGLQLTRTITPTRTPLPRIGRVLRSIAPPEREPERAMSSRSIKVALAESYAAQLAWRRSPGSSSATRSPRRSKTAAFRTQGRQPTARGARIGLSPTAATPLGGRKCGGRSSPCTGATRGIFHT
jgi:AAA domain